MQSRDGHSLTSPPGRKSECPGHLQTPLWLCILASHVHGAEFSQETKKSITERIFSVMNFIVQCLFVWVFICKVTLQIVFYFKLATITENSVTFLSHIGEESSPCCPGISKKTVSIFWRLRNSNIVCL